MTTLFGRYGAPTMLGLSGTKVSRALSGLYGNLIRQFAPDFRGACYKIKPLSCDCHYDVNRFEVQLSVFGLKLLIIDGPRTGHDELPQNADFSQEGLYCAVESFGKADHSLSEEDVKKFVAELMANLQLSS